MINCLLTNLLASSIFLSQTMCDVLMLFLNVLM